jgi:Kdo2-lipid IVA lauroyltransferase/acyltransferase
MTTRALDLRDLRQRGGAWGRAQALKNGALHAAVRATLGVCRLVPARALRVLGRAVGHAAHSLLGGARRTALANVALALPELDERGRRALVLRVFLHLGEHLGDAVALLREGTPLQPLRLDPADREVLAQAIGEGRGVVFASAHLGAWERLGATLVAEGVPLTTVAREAYDPRLDHVYDRLRGGRGVHAIYRGRPGAGARMVRVLKGGGVLGVLMDLRSRVPSIDVPFLGHLAPTAVGPARLALRTGAAVVVGACAPGERARIERIPTADLIGAADRERLLTARINAALSRFILAMPEGWVWMHDRYLQRDRGEGKRNRSIS